MVGSAHARYRHLLQNRKLTVRIKSPCRWWPKPGQRYTQPTPFSRVMAMPSRTIVHFCQNDILIARILNQQSHYEIAMRPVDGFIAAGSANALMELPLLEPRDTRNAPIA